MPPAPWVQTVDTTEGGRICPPRQLAWRPPRREDLTVALAEELQGILLIVAYGKSPVQFRNRERLSNRGVQV